MTPLTQKVTSSLSGGCGFGGNRVRIDGCRIWFYLYDRCRAPATPKRLNGSIVLANCCGSSKNVSRPSPSWRASVRSPFGKPIVTSNMAATETANPGERRQARVYGKTATRLDSTRTALCTRQEATCERGGRAGIARAGTTRARAWVSRNQLGHTLSSWNIAWIDCYRRNWLRFINYWYPSSAGP